MEHTNIIMFSRVWEYMKIANSKLIDNYPVGRANIWPEHIFGMNLGTLKGKTVYQPGVPLSRHIEGVPLSILARVIATRR